MPLRIADRLGGGLLLPGGFSPCSRAGWRHTASGLARRIISTADGPPGLCQRSQSISRCFRKPFYRAAGLPSARSRSPLAQTISAPAQQAANPLTALEDRVPAIPASSSIEPSACLRPDPARHLRKSFPHLPNRAPNPWPRWRIDFPPFPQQVYQVILLAPTGSAMRSRLAETISATGQAMANPLSAQHNPVRAISAAGRERRHARRETG